MADDIKFKAYLYEDNVEKEIRKFSMNKEAVHSFTHLREKLASLFPGLTGRPFGISWKDNEDDMITIGTDEELKMYLLETQETRKLFISLDRTEEPQMEEPNDENLHSGVVCDSCNGRVVGFRYKCTTCQDYDLCSSCEAKGLHPEHFMLRVPVPMVMRNHCIGKKFCKGIQKNMRRQEKWNARRHHFQRESSTAHQAPWAEAAGLWVDTFAGVVHDALESIGSFTQAGTQQPEQPTQPTQGTQTPTATEATPMESETASPATPDVQAPQAPATTATNPEPNGNNERGWVLVNEGATAPAEAQQQQPQPSSSSAPVIEERDPPTLNDKVDESLVKMLGMGFNNEGGWLKQMLMYKNGSIEDVLDILLPMRKLTMQSQ